MYDVDWSTILESNINRQTLDLSVEAICKGISNNEYTTNKSAKIEKEFVIKTIMCLIKNIPMEPVYMYYNETDKQYVIEKGIETILSIYLYINGMFFKNETRIYNSDDIKNIISKDFDKTNLIESEYILNIADNIVKELSFKNFNNKEKDIVLNRKFPVCFIDCKNKNSEDFYKNIFKLI